MTRRRLVLATCLIGLLSGSGAAFAGVASSTTSDHEVCIVLAKDANHNQTQDYCLNWSGATS